MFLLIDSSLISHLSLDSLKCVCGIFVGTKRRREMVKCCMNVKLAVADHWSQFRLTHHLHEWEWNEGKHLLWRQIYWSDPQTWHGDEILGHIWSLYLKYLPYYMLMSFIYHGMTIWCHHFTMVKPQRFTALHCVSLSDHLTVSVRSQTTGYTHTAGRITNAESQ